MTNDVPNRPYDIAQSLADLQQQVQNVGQEWFEQQERIRRMTPGLDYPSGYGQGGYSEGGYGA